MNIQTKYKPYDASWQKLGTVVGSSAFIGGIIFAALEDYNKKAAKKAIAQSLDVNIDSKYYARPILPLSLAGYFAHNLYAQYQYNASQEKQINVNIDGNIKVIDVSPQYFDSYSMYNLLGLTGTAMIGVCMPTNLDNLANIGIGLTFLSPIPKLISMYTGDYHDLIFTDHETGEIIPHEILFPDLNDQ